MGWLLIKNGAGLQMSIQEHRTPLMPTADGEHQVLLWKRQRSTQSQGGLESQRCRKRWRLEKSTLYACRYSTDRSSKPWSLASNRWDWLQSREMSPRCGMGAKGAKIDGDCKLSSSLILAVENGHHCVMRALLELGASVDAVHIYGDTALKTAAHNDHLGAVRASKNMPKGREMPRWLRPSSMSMFFGAQLLRSRGAKPGVDYETFQQAQRGVPQLDSAGNVSWI